MAEAFVRAMAVAVALMMHNLGHSSAAMDAFPSATTCRASPHHTGLFPCCYSQLSKLGTGHLQVSRILAAPSASISIFGQSWLPPLPEFQGDLIAQGGPAAPV